jgi:TPR repeat protein
MIIRKTLVFIFLTFLSFCRLYAQASNHTPTPQLTPEQIALHPADKWFTAERPDYSELDARVKNLAKNEETPEAVARIICEGLTTDIEKARAIYDWLACNIEYDMSLTIYDYKKGFARRKGVCEVYAYLFYYMAKEVGLNAYIVEGKADSLENHVWNFVQLPERDMLLDSCWGSGYAKNGRFYSLFRAEWFDPHPAAFAYTHLPFHQELSFVYPPVSEKDFKRLPHLTISDYFPFGPKDPVEDFHNRFCKEKQYLPVSYSLSRTKNLYTQYISTGPSVTDGFFINEFETSISQVKKCLGEENIKNVLEKNNNCTEEDSSAITDLPLPLIAEYCNKLNEEFGFEMCYTINGGKIECDYSKCGFRLPTKKEWLLACGTRLLDKAVSLKDFSDAVWFDQNSGGRINSIKETKANENNLYDILGNVSELCYDEETDLYVFMGGNIYSSQEELLSNQPVIYDDYKNNKGAHGFRLAFTPPETSALQYKIAQNYNFGGLVEQNQKLCRQWFELSVNNGNINALAYLGSLYVQDYTPEAMKKGYEMCLKAAEQGQNYALYMLAFMYQNGVYVQENQKTAAGYFLKSAEAGYSVSMREIAHYYEAGEFIQKDLEQYFYWLKKYVEMEDSDKESKIELIKCYLNGKGCEKNKDNDHTAYLLLRDMNNITSYKLREDTPLEARVLFADCYANGIGCAERPEEAAKYYKLAMEAGSIYAKAQYADLRFHGKDKLIRDVKEATELYRQIVETGYSDSEYKEEYKTTYEYYRHYWDIMTRYEDDCRIFVVGISLKENVTEYLDLLEEITEVSQKIQNAPVTYSALLRGLTYEQLKTKILVPEQKILKGEKLKGKTLVIINPYRGKKLTGTQDAIYTSDLMLDKRNRIYDEWLKYDTSFFGYYDNIILLQKEEENLNSVDTAFKKIMPCLMECTQADLFIFSTDYFKNDSAYVQAYRELAKNHIDRGINPRIIVPGNRTDVMQQNINGLFSGASASYAEKIHVFGTPCDMAVRFSLGFKNGNLNIAMVTEKINGKQLYIYIEENGEVTSSARRDLTFVQSQQNLSNMTSIGIDKTGSICKPGNMVMRYKKVKEDHQW